MDYEALLGRGQSSDPTKKKPKNQDSSYESLLGRDKAGSTGLLIGAEYNKSQEKEKTKKDQEKKQADEKKKQEEQNKPLNILARISKPISEGGANPLADAGKWAQENVVKATVDSAKNAYKQAKITSDAIGLDKPGINQKFIDSQNKAIDDAVKQGKYTKEKAAAEKAKLSAKFETQKQKIAEAEKREGVKYDPNQGAIDAINTLSMIDLPVAAGKKLGEAGVRSGSSLIAKLSNRATEKAATKEAEKLFGGVDKAATAAAEAKTPKPISVADESLGSEKVGVTTPVRPGIRQESTTYNVNVRTPKEVTDVEYTKRFNSLSKQYDKEMKALEGKPELTQKAASESIDAKYSKLMDDLDNEYKNGVLPKKTIISKISSKTSKAEPTTGGAPKEGVNVPTSKTPRSSSYVADTTKKRVTKEEAAAKLERAGYTTDESTAILADALPDKGLSMPGSPKKIGLNEESIVKSAQEFDGVQEGSSLKPLAPIDESGEKGVSKLASSVQDNALHEKLITKTEAESTNLPTYAKADMKQQAEYATSLIKEDPQSAIDIAMGRKAPPEHVLQQMVFNAVEAHAKTIGGEKGGQLIRDLALKSKQSTNLTKMGQEIRAAAERDPHSPVTMIDEVRLARAEAAKRRGKDISKALKADTEAIKKATPKVKKEDWNSFVQSLEC